jgi:hypothetical protein
MELLATEAGLGTPIGDLERDSIGADEVVNRSEQALVTDKSRHCGDTLGEVDQALRTAVLLVAGSEVGADRAEHGLALVGEGLRLSGGQYVIDGDPSAIVVEHRVSVARPTAPPQRYSPGSRMWPSDLRPVGRVATWTSRTRRPVCGSARSTPTAR